jgi:hypothetical protein
MPRKILDRIESYIQRLRITKSGGYQPKAMIPQHHDLHMCVEPLSTGKFWKGPQLGIPG